MRPHAVVVITPAIDFGFGLSVAQAREPVFVQALVSELPVEALDVSVLHRRVG
jgi:hypothetical protein